MHPKLGQLGEHDRVINGRVRDAQPCGKVAVLRFAVWVGAEDAGISSLKTSPSGELIRLFKTEESVSDGVTTGGSDVCGSCTVELGASYSADS